MSWLEEGEKDVVKNGVVALGWRADVAKTAEVALLYFAQGYFRKVYRSYKALKQHAARLGVMGDEKLVEIEKNDRLYCSCCSASIAIAQVTCKICEQDLCPDCVCEIAACHDSQQLVCPNPGCRAAAGAAARQAGDCQLEI